MSSDKSLTNSAQPGPNLHHFQKGTTQRANKHDRTLKSVPVPIFHVSEPKQFMPVPFSLPLCLSPFLFFLFSFFSFLYQ